LHPSSGGQTAEYSHTYVVMIVMVCEKLDNPLEQILAGDTLTLLARSSLDFEPKLDRAEIVRVSQPLPAPMDYPLAYRINPLTPNNL
jgi:hypothetical protein